MKLQSHKFPVRNSHGSLLVHLIFCCFFGLLVQAFWVDFCCAQQIPSRIDTLQITRGAITPASPSEAARLQENLIRSIGPMGTVNVRQFQRTSPNVVDVEGSLPRGFPGYSPRGNAPGAVADVSGRLPAGFPGARAGTRTPAPARDIYGPMPSGF
jgi:hypothetical protein